MSDPVKLGKDAEESPRNLADGGAGSGHDENDQDSNHQDWNNDDELILMRRKRHRQTSENEGLNLTAMMDMFTIILVFLIKQYASAPENIQLSEILQPPVSTTDNDIQPAVTIFVTKTDIVVDGKKVADISSGRLVAPAGQDPLLGLSTELRKIVERLKLLEERSGGVARFDGMVMMVVDEETTYELLNNVLLVAGRNEFNTYKMIVKAGGKK